MLNQANIPFTLTQDIGPEDCLVIATQGAEAFLPDVQTRLKAFNLPPQPVSDSHVRDWLSSPACHVLKAVSVENNEIMGSICWVTRGYVPRLPQLESTKGRLTDKSGEEGTKTKIQQLENLTDSHFAQFMTDIMPEGTKCWFIGGLTVAPQFQGMGVGRALIEWGLRRAEEDGVFAWVHSSEMAWRGIRLVGLRLLGS